MNFNLILNWLLGNIAWIIIFGIFIKLIPGIFRIFKIGRKLLNKNRRTLGNTNGKYLADRFMKVWYSKEPVVYKEIRFTCIANRSQVSTQKIPEKDDELIDMKLIATKDGKIVKPIVNWQNRCVARLIKFYLIKFIGDNPKYYGDLSK